jgi:SAM-dependent MidA family methyltransferase
MKELHAIVHVEILQMGAIRFDRFMELALYHPEFGYYRRERGASRTGREGDFYTSVSVGPLFGRLLGRQFFQMWDVLGKPDPFWIIEQGAEDGQLACDVLEWCREATPEFFEALHYGIVESFAPLREWQRRSMEGGPILEKVRWFRNVIELAAQEPVGVFFSNELVDSFPVRLIIRRDAAWYELQVTLGRKDDFAWIEKPVGDRELAEAVKALRLPAIDGYTTEINLRARDWMEDMGQALRRGYFLTIDYGFPASVYYAPFRIGGTLTAYRDHRRTEDILSDPGSRDITAHVDFTALAAAGERAGLATLGFLDQQHFLMGIAHDELSGLPGTSTGIAEKVRAWQTLIHPNHFGSRFQVLVQGRDAPSALDGLKYGRPLEE